MALSATPIIVLPVMRFRAPPGLPVRTQRLAHHDGLHVGHGHGSGTNRNAGVSIFLDHSVFPAEWLTRQCSVWARRLRPTSLAGLRPRRLGALLVSSAVGLGEL